jgi:hypothetical protein
MGSRYSSHLKAVPILSVDFVELDDPNQPHHPDDLRGQMFTTVVHTQHQHPSCLEQSSVLARLALPLQQSKQPPTQLSS